MNDLTHTGSDVAVVLTAKVVTAFVSNNAIAPGDISGLIGSVYAVFGGLGQPVILPADELVPAVPIKKSVMPDFIICLDDGKKFKSMKGHLAGLSMTPDEYRSKWGLPSDYPMVAPNYSAARSLLAKNAGLGRKSEAKAVSARQTARSKSAA